MGRTRTGSIYKRGGVWWVSYTVEVAPGVTRRVNESLQTGDETAARDRVAAMKEAHVFTDLDRAIAYHERCISHLRELRGEAARRRSVVPLSGMLAAFNRSPRRGTVGATTEDRHGSAMRWLLEWYKRPDAPMDAITPDVAAAFGAYLAESGLSTGRQASLLGALHRTWSVVQRDVALERGENTTPMNPWAREFVPRPRVRSRRHRPLTTDEIRKLFAHFEGEANGEWTTLLRIMLNTGLRQKDAALLEWACIDLDRQYIRVAQHKTRHADTRPVLIPLQADFVAHLRTLPRDDEHVLPTLAGEYKRMRQALTIRFTRACRALKIEGDATGSVGTHSLRHTAAQLMVDAGTPLDTVKALLGHHLVSMTMIYAEVGLEERRRAIEALPGWGDADASAG